MEPPVGPHKGNAQYAIPLYMGFPSCRVGNSLGIGAMIGDEDAGPFQGFVIGEDIIKPFLKPVVVSGLFVPASAVATQVDILLGGGIYGGKYLAACHE